jgi:major membrane immunogen (membrane-anchored lipoprotein)
MLKLVTIAGRVVLGASGLLLTGCAYRDYHHGRYDGPQYRGYYERVDYRYGDRYYDRDGYRHRVRYSDRYGRCD